jgi:hypothetical protein
MNNSLIFIFFLIAGISCSQPEKNPDINAIYQSLADQKHLFYNVEYSICNSEGSATNNLFGLVALNRNSDSGISSAYFGHQRNQQAHYIHSMFLQHDWVYILSSPRYNVEDADVITDSLHSPVLLNPELLLQINEDSVSISNQNMGNGSVKWIFELKNKPDQLILVWNDNQEKISEIEYKYAINSDNTYSRKWAFDYISKSEFTQLEKGFKQENQRAHQPFL